MLEQNGEINRYEIRLYEVGDSEDEQIVNVTGNLTKTFSGLKSFTAYGVRVRAATSAGSGPWSSPQYLKTMSEGERRAYFKER